MSLEKLLHHMHQSFIFYQFTLFVSFWEIISWKGKVSSFLSPCTSSEFELVSLLGVTVSLFSKSFLQAYRVRTSRKSGALSVGVYSSFLRMGKWKCPRRGLPGDLLTPNDGNLIMLDVRFNVTNWNLGVKDCPKRKEVSLPVCIRDSCRRRNRPNMDRPRTLVYFSERSPHAPAMRLTVQVVSSLLKSTPRSSTNPSSQ